MSFITPILMSILETLLTKKVFSEVLCEMLRAWSDWTNNEYDDKIVDSISSALSVDSASVKELLKK